MKAGSAAAVALLAFVCLAPQPALADDKPQDVAVFAAASTRAALEEAVQGFSAEAGVGVEVVPGPSSGLAKQIVAGADAELFLSADLPTAQYLRKQGLVAEQRHVLTNRLVVIAPADSHLEWKGLDDLVRPQVTRIAVGEQKVPVGEYTRQALRAAKVLEQVEEKFVGSVDVKAALQYVARGEVEAGFVYATDAVGEQRVKVVLDVDPKLHAPIVYPLLLLKRNPMRPEARRLFEYLAGDKALRVFRQAGFGAADAGNADAGNPDAPP